MQIHGNAKLVPSARLLLVRRVVEEHGKVADVAAGFGVSERTAYRWLARWRAGDRELVDRSSAPRRVPRRTSRRVEVLIEKLRRLRMTSTRIAAELDMAVSTVGAVLAAARVASLCRVSSRPSHRTGMTVDTPASWSISTSRNSAASCGPAIESLDEACRAHVAMRCCAKAGSSSTSRSMTTSRVAYVEILGDQRAETCVAFFERANAWFVERGVRRASESSPTTDPAIAHERSPHRALAHKIQHVCAHDRIDRAPTAKQNDSSKPCCANGPTRPLRDQRPPQPGPRTLDRLLQPPTTTRRHQPPSTRHAAHRHLNNVPGNYN